jgi:Phage tail tube protein
MALINNIKSVSLPSFGKLPLADKPGTFTPSSTKREAKAGRLPNDGGFTETSAQAKLELSINLLGGIDFDTLNNISAEDVTIRLADGHVYLMAKAFCTDVVSVGDSEAKLVLMSNTSERVS